MADPTFKLADLKTLKELAVFLSYPVVGVAYNIQSEPGIGFDDVFYFGISQAWAPAGQLFMFLVYFALKVIWACGWLAAFNLFLVPMLERSAEVVLLFFGVVLTSLGVAGLLAVEAFPLLGMLNKFWFFTFLVLGFSCYSHLDTLSETASEIRKRYWSGR